MRIHSTAIVHRNAKIAEDVEIGPFSIIGEHVTIGKGTKIAAHARIEGWTTIGEENQIYSFARIGAPPQDMEYSNEETYVIIGNNNVFRECATVHRGTINEDCRTLIGDNNYLMAYAHVAHNCKLGNNIILVNSVALGGHICVGDHAFLGGLTAVRQFVKIGSYSIIGGQSAVTLDIPPYVSAAGNRAQLHGLNLIGLKRKGFSSEIINNLKKAYKIIFRLGLTLEESVRTALCEMPDSNEVAHLIEFIRNSRLGITR